MGLQVNSLELMYDHPLQQGHDYVMRVKVESWERGVLKGRILKLRDLDDITSH